VVAGPAAAAQTGLTKLLGEARAEKKKHAVLLVVTPTDNGAGNTRYVPLRLN